MERVAAPTSVVIADAAYRLAWALSDPATARQVTRAHIVVQVTVGAGPGQTLTVDLRSTDDQRGRPRGRRHSEVRLTAHGDDLDLFWRTDKRLPLMILSGEVAFEGPVRKLLRVLPVLRAAAASAPPRALAPDPRAVDSPNDVSPRILCGAAVR
jgi:hypothetical protein